ncbi:MAG: VWA domain-containing protein [Candidatus Hydrogenedentes bacterium]|nr:VWA domain-containing protein [Candidatus Hydrogenedentota bacterium]
MRWQIIVALSYVIVILSVSTGCPRIDFYLDPESVTFGESSTQISFRVIYSQGGNWEWTAETDASWLKISSDRGLTSSNKVSGKLAGEKILFLDLIADRSGLNEGTTNAEVKVTSLGTTRILKVSIVKAPEIQVYINPQALNFGPILSEAQVTIYNQSSIDLNWQLKIPNNVNWVKASPVSGAVKAKNNTIITVTVDREGLSAGEYSTTLTIEVGDKSLQLAVTMEVAGLKISPAELNFGLVYQQTAQTLTFSNIGARDLSVSLSVGDGVGWMSLSSDRLELGVGESEVVEVTVNPNGLQSNDYSGNILVREVNTNFSVNVAVRMRIPGLVVEPLNIDFGKVRELTTLPINITNRAPVAIRWTSRTSANSSWLRVSPTNGVVESSQSQSLNVSGDPLVVSPGVYEGDILIESNWGSATVHVRMEAGRAPKLVVVPTTVNFGDSRTDETLAIWNGGEDTIEWSVDTDGFPAWLSLTPVDSNGVASGSVSGAQTSLLKLKVDRSLADPNLGPNYSFTFEVLGRVLGNQQSLPNVPVYVSMTVPQVPEIEVIGEGVDSNGVPFINFEFEEYEQEFVIKNVGKGTLEWSIDISKLPGWVTGVNPTQGIIQRGREQRVKISVNRSTLDYRGATARVEIVSNDPNNPRLPLTVEVQVEKQVKIAVNPTALNYGPLEMLKTFDVANAGDPGTILNFKIVSNKEWISAYPDSGVSIGIEGTDKDWKTISVAIDREKLEGISSSGEISIVATRVVNGQVVIDTRIAPAKVTITVSAPGLTIESAPPKLRIPSLVRYVFVFRDVQQRAIRFPEVFLPELSNKILITEGDLPLDVSESNRFIMPFVKQERIVPFSGTVLIMLDASGSMLQSAKLVEDTSISQAPDPLRELYIRVVSPFIQELPPNYKIGIGVFNEREWLGSSLRMITGNDSEPMFTYNKQVALSRLQSFGVVDNGATELLPAVISGILEMLLADGDHVPFDVSDDRIMLMITDGKLTTPPGEVSPVVDLLKSARVRPFIVGWGNEVNANVLIQLIEETGGHFYSTKGRNTGLVDSLGRPIISPLVSSLEDWLVSNSADVCDRSITEDIKNQILFEYVALNQTSGTQIRLDVSMDSPADDFSPCLRDQGVISTVIAHSQLDLLTYANDVRLGQIKLISKGIDSTTSTAEVIVYADYIPRNISMLRLQVEPSDGNIITSVSLPTSVEGGIIPDWSYSWSGDVLTLASPSSPLPYGAFGVLCVLNFQNVTGPFDLGFDVVAPQYTPGTENKYFTHPDTFRIDYSEDFRPSNPYPAIDTDPPMEDGTYTVTMPDDVTDLTVYIYNIGGSHRPTNVGLQWDVEVIEGDFLGILNRPEDEEDRIVFENTEPFALQVLIDESATGLVQGWNMAILQFTFNSIFNNPIVRFLTVYYYHTP